LHKKETDGQESVRAGSGNSRPVQSNQADVHPRLLAHLQRQSARPWQQPYHRPSRRVFQQIEEWRLAQGRERPVVVDAGCGTGLSTVRLAGRYPDALIVGIDRSAARLQRAGVAVGDAPRTDGRVLWARAELETFWRLALAAQWPVEAHYLLYPNPWPKSAHLGRRWHGHPVFPTLLALGRQIHLRCNWRIYADEFALAARSLGREVEGPERLAPAGEPALSPFEEKYRASGHALWGVNVSGRA